MYRRLRLARTARLAVARGAKLGLAILIATPFTTAIASNSGGQASAMNIEANGQVATIVSQRSIAGGDVAESWSVGGVTVTAAGQPGSTVTVSSFGKPGGPGGATVSLRSPAIGKNGPDAGARAVQSYKSSGRSVQAEALAVGYSAAEIGSSFPSIRSKLATGGSSATLVPGNIYNSGCTDVTGDGGSAHGHACIVQKLMQDNGNGDWYVGDEIVSTGWDSEIWFWGLTGLQSWDQFGANNTIVNYSPSSQQHPSSCGSVTFGLSYNGIGVSATNSLCPDTLDPRFFGSTGFGTNWTGCAAINQTVGAPGVDIDHNPYNASEIATINTSIWWNCVAHY